MLTRIILFYAHFIDVEMEVGETITEGELGTTAKLISWETKQRLPVPWALPSLLWPGVLRGEGICLLVGVVSVGITSCVSPSFPPGIGQDISQ